MSDVPELRTERLLLRGWRQSDLEPFAALNADPVVMEHFPSTLFRQQSDELVARIELSFAVNGYGAWAVEVPGEAPLIGFVGLIEALPPLPFAPGIEVGWRLARAAWGKGYATEAARAALAFAFHTLDAEELLAYTYAGNERSRRVMQRLGMTHDPSEDFPHPQLPASHRLSQHVLYRLSAERWHELEDGDTDVAESG